MPHQPFDDLDVEQIEPMEMTEMEKKKIERYVRAEVPTKRRVGVIGRVAAAAAILTTSVVGASFMSPTIASQIPFMENVVSLFDQNEAKNEHATIIGQVKTSNGISTMVDRAIFDGNTVTIYFAVELDEPVPGAVGLQQGVGNLQVKKSSGMAGTERIEKIDDLHYIGMMEMTLFDHDAPTASVVWDMEAWEFYNADNEVIKTVDTDWTMAFSVEAEEATTTTVMERSSVEGVDVILESMTRTPISTSLHVKTVASREAREALPPLQGVAHSLFGGETSIEELNMFSPTFRVVDDLGNEYVVSGGAGTMEGEGPMYSLSTFDPIHEEAKSLTITPILVERDMQEMPSITIQL